MIQNIRVGIPIVGTKEWAGGISYIELLTKAVASLPKNERPRLFFIIPESGLEAFGSHRHITHLFDGLIFLGRDRRQAAGVISQPFDHATSWKSLFTKIDFYFPEVVDVLPNVCAASWIPDFQYVHLKQFFSKQEAAMRGSMAKKIADKARLVVLSSQDVKKDFENEFPDSKAIVRVLSFYSLPLEEWYRPNPIQVQKKYDLPDLFLICCNQFWMHKNHIRIFESVAHLREQGQDVHLVCTGNTKDHRAKGYFEMLSKRIDALAIDDLVHILGYIPRHDQIQLLRRSAAVIQPSLFEGWGTVVEDARALGKTIFLSKIPIHFEQSPNHAIFFDPHDTEELACAIQKSLPGLPGKSA